MNMDMKTAHVNQITSLPVEFLAATHVDQISYLQYQSAWHVKNVCQVSHVYVKHRPCCFVESIKKTALSAL